MSILEHVAAHLRAGGHRARFVYTGVLGGPDVAVTLVDDDHLELRARLVVDEPGHPYRGAAGQRSELAVLSTSVRVIERVLASLADANPRGRTRRTMMTRVRALLEQTCQRWVELARGAPVPTVSAPRDRPALAMCGLSMSVDGLAVSAAAPLYGASIVRGSTRVCVPSGDGHATVSSPIEPVVFERRDAWWSCADPGCPDVGCEAPCFDVIPDLDCPLGCDLG